MAGDWGGGGVLCTGARARGTPPHSGLAELLGCTPAGGAASLCMAFAMMVLCSTAGLPACRARPSLLLL